MRSYLYAIDIVKLVICFCFCPVNFLKGYIMSGADYSVASEHMNLKEKEEFLRELGQESMIKVFDNYKPKNTFAKRRRRATTAPLDQRMTLTVTRDDRKLFEDSLRDLESAGEDVSMSSFVRNKALGSPDIFGWKNTAIETLKDFKYTVENKKTLNKRLASLEEMIDEERDADIAAELHRERNSIADKLLSLKANPSKRTQRLSGRVTFAESEMIKWRASRLCISTSDYLRMMIFDLAPNSEADRHMSLAARQRFYIAIGDVAKNGWGDVPGIGTVNSPEYGHMAQRIKELEQENRQLREVIRNDRVNADIS